MVSAQACTQGVATELQATPAWAQELAREEDALRIIDAAALLSESQPHLEEDHIFAALLSHGIVEDLTGYYSEAQQRFQAVICLGRRTAGWPRVVHGGLTAAIIDECFGGLLFGLKRAAFTASLEVQYKHKIAAGSTILCTTRVASQEGRKLWMEATVSDGPEGTVFATARALFIQPKPQQTEQAAVQGPQDGAAVVGAP